MASLPKGLEMFVIGAVLAGFVIARLVTATVMSYVLLGLAALIAGRYAYFSRTTKQPASTILAAAFLAGYLLGHRIVQWWALGIFFIAIAAASYYVQKELRIFT